MTGLPPKPTHNFFPLRFSPPAAVSDLERRAMIERAAYLRAERRGFAGDCVEDWLTAEAQVDHLLAQQRRLAGITGGYA